MSEGVQNCFFFFFLFGFLEAKERLLVSFSLFLRLLPSLLIFLTLLCDCIFVQLPFVMPVPHARQRIFTQVGSRSEQTTRTAKNEKAEDQHSDLVTLQPQPAEVSQRREKRTKRKEKVRTRSRSRFSLALCEAVPIGLLVVGLPVPRVALIRVVPSSSCLNKKLRSGRTRRKERRVEMCVCVCVFRK